MGRTAYYASKMGLRPYTIIDIPMTSAAQAAFLGKRSAGACEFAL
ncbi:hypothetical protein L838_5619 [Mycobacterium avium MAV_120709_2344]|nr:hypothetical protein L838_5619 [Mycobacterium avium MAV_120709_2344]